ncbi:unnamed protein product [Paramecium sonneborni]|uniref:Uncharacterized protein n=1 Tax=Paramecium sonneborni TaxID=65129 RepID=A0A8S1M473_9CILI|nr:unnamed protein product [Paramecium sonneborni]
MCCLDKQKKSPQKQPLQIRSNQQGQKKDIKVVLLGDCFVGKSSIASRFCTSQYQSQYELTVVAAYNSIDMVVKGQQLKIHLWDTAGEEKYKSLLSLYYRDANAAIIVYDITSTETFNSVQGWLKELDEKIQNNEMVLALVGNKCDCLESERKIPKQKASNFAKTHGMIFKETSAKTGEGIKQIFTQLIEQYAQDKL